MLLACITSRKANACTQHVEVRPHRLARPHRSVMTAAVLYLNMGAMML